MDRQVPNYTIDGGQHRKLPYIDKEMYANVKPIPEWERQPAHRTRAELLADRRTKQLPDISYDIDNDGVVGPTDYFIGKRFDKDNKGSLTAAERQECDKAVRDGYLDTFVFGLDKSGVNSTSNIFQRRGVVYSNDCPEDLTTSYPLPDTVNPVRTRSQLLIDRKSEHINSAKALANLAESKSFIRGRERVVQNSNYVPQPPITNISERKEADHQVARIACGLFPVSSFVNPAREEKSVSLDYVEDPPVKTRAQLQTLRKLDAVQELRAQRNSAEKSYVPSDVKSAMREAAAFEFREAPDVTKTFTQLKYERKCDAIDYNARIFQKTKQAAPVPEQPGNPWFSKMGAEPVDLPPIVSPDFKITQKHWTPPELQPDRFVVAPLEGETSNAKFVKKRWTTDLIEQHQLRGAPRFFDSLPNANTLASDVAPLEHFSSFELIKKGALRAEVVVKRQNLEKAISSRNLPGDRRETETVPRETRLRNIKTSGFDE